MSRSKNVVLTREKVPRLVAKAILISVLIQVPFLILISFGVHSVPGAIGYLFYYAWILILDRLAGNWQNNGSLLLTVLCILQTIPLSAIVFLLMAFKQRPGSDGGSTRG